MRAQDVMSSPVITVTPETTAKEAARLLSRNGFTALPVTTEDRLIGMVTEADLIGDRVRPDPRFRRDDRPAGPPPGTTVAEVMTTPAMGMAPGTDLAVLARTLFDDRIRAVPIVDGARVVGIVTRGDIVRVFARDDEDIAADVRHHLAIYGGQRRWQVEVKDGIARIIDDYDNETDRHVAALLAEAVPGVVNATVTSRSPEGMR